ncbi:MAG: hypothetical protein ACUVUS_03450 [Thermoproteota archaeon]
MQIGCMIRLSIPLSLLLLIMLSMPTGVEAQPLLCFMRAYNASFSSSLNIYPSGSFTWVHDDYGYLGYFTNGFIGACLNATTTHPGGYSYVYHNFSNKGSFKISFVLRIMSNSNFNFSVIRLYMTGSPTYEFKLGRSNDKLKVYRGDRINEGISLQTEKWYNLTVSLDASTDTLTILCNNTPSISFSTGSKLYSIRQVSFQMGIINTSSDYVEAYFDEFSMLSPPIIFTDKPIYTSSSDVLLKITGDQFFAPPFNITIIRPDGSTLTRIRITSVNLTGGFSNSTILNNPAPGTYIIRVNSTGCRVEYHFGVWNLTRIWERKSVIRAKSGGLIPNSFVMLYVMNSTQTVFSQRLNSGSWGEIDWQMTVPPDLPIGNLTAYLEYADAFDFKNMGGVTDTIRIEVIKAVLNVTVKTDYETYERVRPIDIKVQVKYKDGSSISRESIIKLRLAHGGVEGMNIFMDYVHDGYWIKGIKLNPSDPIGSYVIKVEASDPYGNFGVGNKTIFITIAKLSIDLRHQLESSYQRSTKLNISVSVAYPDNTSVNSGQVTLEMVKDQQKKGPFFFNRTGLGQWDFSKIIPIGEQTGNWTIKISAVDDSDNRGDLSFTIVIVPAKLVVEPLNQPGTSFSRTQSIPIGVKVRYPSNENLSWEYGTVEALLVHEDSVVSNKSLQFSAGSWSGNISAPKSAPLGSYVLRISAGDRYENYGYYNTTMEITKAILNIALEGLRDVYQTGFDTISFELIISYPDGSTLDEGNVITRISSGSMSYDIEARYKNGRWVGQYYLPLTFPVGDYSILFNATDPYGNMGVKDAVFRVSNLYLILIIISIAIALGASASILLIRRRRQQPPMVSEDYDVLS